MEGMLIEEVHAAVQDMVELIKTYRSKRRISKVIVSTMFKRRMEETEATIDRAISDLKVSSFTCSNPLAWKIRFESTAYFMPGSVRLFN